MIAEVDIKIQEALYQYGLNLGIAFQLADDVLDYEGNAATMGKNVGDDLAEGKPTLPLIYSIEIAKHDEADIIINAIKQKDASNINEIVKLVHHNGAIEYTKNFAESYIEQAKKELKCLPESEFRDGLSQLADFALHRSS